MKVRPGDIILVDKRYDLIGQLIKLILRAKYHHCILVADNYFTIEKGKFNFISRPLKLYLTSLKSSRLVKFKIVRYKGKINRKEIKKMASIVALVFRDYLGVKGAIKSLLGYLGLKYVPFNCASFIGIVFNLCKIDKKLDYWKLTPKSFENNDLFKVIEEE